MSRYQMRRMEVERSRKMLDQGLVSRPEQNCSILTAK